MQQKNTTSTNAFWLYLLIANGITWLGWIPALLIAQQQGYLLPTTDNIPALAQQGYINTQHRFIALGFSLAVYGPLLGGIVATWLEEGSSGLKNLLHRLTVWRINLKWYGYTILIALSLAILPVGVGLLLNWIQPATLTINAYLPYALVIFGRQILTSGLGEEPGWRGYLLPKLRQRFTGDTYIWVLGLIWAIWHYPITIYVTSHAITAANPAQLIITLLIGLAGQTISLIGITFIYVWLYNRTQSLWLMVLFHALSNTATTLFASEIQGPVSLLIAAMPWAIVFILEKVFGKDSFINSNA